MNRGSVRSGRAAATAGLNRSVWPTARTTPRVRGGRDHLVGFGERLRAIGFSTSTGTPALQERQRDFAVQLGRHRDASRRRPARAGRGSR